MVCFHSEIKLSLNYPCYPFLTGALMQTLNQIDMIYRISKKNKLKSPVTFKIATVYSMTFQNSIYNQTNLDSTGLIYDLLDPKLPKSI